MKALSKTSEPYMPPSVPGLKPHPKEDAVLAVILIVVALIMKLIFKKFFPNVSSLKEVVITGSVLLAIVIIYLIFVPV